MLGGFELISESMLVLNMGILLLMGGLCSLIFKRLKMPVVIGYLVSGIIIAYFHLNTDGVVEIVELLSDIGLVLLMFVIGLELNLKKLKQIGSGAIMTVLIMVPIILIGGMLLGSLVLHLNFLQSLIFAAVLSGSSTAVVLIVQNDQRNLSKSDLETLLLMLVVEDVVQVVILSALTPIMHGSTMAVEDIVWMMNTILLFMVLSVVVGIAVVPRFLEWVRSKTSGEVLVIVALGICFGLSYLSIAIGMSMAIGQFLAGVIISQQDCSKEVEENANPIKNVFLMMFFISIGFEISVPALINNIGQIIIISLIYLILMFVQLMAGFVLTGKSLRLSYKSAVALLVMGEFAFIISKEALNTGIFSSDVYTSIVGAALVTMITLPILNKQSDRIIQFVAAKSPAKLRARMEKLGQSNIRFKTRLSKASSVHIDSMRRRTAPVYVYAAFIILIQIAFVLAFSLMSEFFLRHLPPDIPRTLAAGLVLLVDFLILLVPMYILVRRIKYLLRTYLNSCRKAANAGKNVNWKFINGVIYVARSNNGPLAISLQFLLTVCMPVQIDTFTRIFVMAIGLMLLAAVIGYRNEMSG